MSENSILNDIYDDMLEHPGTLVANGGSDGCGLNSLIGCELMRARGLKPFEIILQDPQRRFNFSPVPAADEPSSNALGAGPNFSWQFHCAVACKTAEGMVVCDPLLFDGPVRLDEYLEAFPPLIGRKHTVRDSSAMSYIEVKDSEGRRGSREFLEQMNWHAYAVNAGSKIVQLMQQPDFHAVQREIAATRCGPTLGEFARTIPRRAAPGKDFS